jgi:hypothetical protein
MKVLLNIQEPESMKVLLIRINKIDGCVAKRL